MFFLKWRFINEGNGIYESVSANTDDIKRKRIEDGVTQSVFGLFAFYLLPQGVAKAI